MVREKSENKMNLKCVCGYTPQENNNMARHAERPSKVCGSQMALQSSCCHYRPRAYRQPRLTFFRCTNTTLIGGPARRRRQDDHQMRTSDGKVNASRCATPASRDITFRQKEGTEFFKQLAKAQDLIGGTMVS
jgi:hypothetical protein